MAYTTSAQRHYPVTEALRVLGGIVILLAFGDVLVLSALAVAIAAMIAIWWAHRGVEHGVEKDAALAPVTQLRHVSTSRRYPNRISADESWWGPSAA